jgi:hypothetical protein
MVPVEKSESLAIPLSTNRAQYPIRIEDMVLVDCQGIFIASSKEKTITVLPFKLQF